MRSLLEFLSISFGWERFDSLEERLEQQLQNMIDNQQADELVKVGIKDGFLNDQLRFKAYETIMKIKHYTIHNKRPTDKIKDLDVIKNDVHRSFNVNSAIKDMPWSRRAYFKDLLHETITGFFGKNRQYFYYQGFHSIAERLVTHYRSEDSLCAIERFSKLFFKDQLCDKTFSKSIYFFHDMVKEVLKAEGGLTVDDS